MAEVEKSAKEEPPKESAIVEVMTDGDEKKPTDDNEKGETVTLRICLPPHAELTPVTIQNAIALKQMLENMRANHKEAQATKTRMWNQWRIPNDGWWHGWPSEVFDSHQTLFLEGKIVWGHLVQANNIAFSQNCGCAFNDFFNQQVIGADLVFSLDPNIDQSTGLLAYVAELLFSLKGARPEQVEDPEVRKIVRAITDEQTVLMWRAIPTTLTGGVQFYFNTFAIYRKHLPRGILEHSLFPLVVSPTKKTVGTIILPHQHWDEDYLNRVFSD